jgi:hypothetical protein
VPAPAQFDPAIHVDQLYDQLTDEDAEPWAAIDPDGNLLVWTDRERLADALGLADQRYATTWREDKWVLSALWDEKTQLESWLEPNKDNPSRPIVRFAARPRQ